jgi:hypothetical protein
MTLLPGDEALVRCHVAVSVGRATSLSDIDSWRPVPFRRLSPPFAALRLRRPSPPLIPRRP